jgi:hypothetical protein
MTQMGSICSAERVPVIAQLRKNIFMTVASRPLRLTFYLIATLPWRSVFQRSGISGDQLINVNKSLVAPRFPERRVKTCDNNHAKRRDVNHVPRVWGEHPRPWGEQPMKRGLMTIYRRLLGAAALGTTAAVFGFAMPQQASAAFCTGFGGTFDCGTYVDTFSGNTLGQPPGDTVSTIASEAKVAQDFVSLLSSSDNNQTYALNNAAFIVTGAGIKEGTWSSTGSAPDGTFITVNAGNFFSLGEAAALGSGVASGYWSTEGILVRAGNPLHVSYVDGWHSDPVVPVALPLLLAAFGALGLIGRRK